MTHTTRKPKQASLDGGRMKNSSSSGGGQGCLTHGWLLLLLSFLQPHCLLESFLPTAPEYIFIPQQRSVPGSRLNSCSALVGLAQGHPYTPFRAASFFFSSLHSFSLSSPAPQVDNARVGCDSAVPAVRQAVTWPWGHRRVSRHGAALSLS